MTKGVLWTMQWRLDLELGTYTVQQWRTERSCAASGEEKAAECGAHRRRYRVEPRSRARGGGGRERASRRRGGCGHLDCDCKNGDGCRRGWPRPWGGAAALRVVDARVLRQDMAMSISAFDHRRRDAHAFCNTAESLARCSLLWLWPHHGPRWWRGSSWRTMGALWVHHVGRLAFQGFCAAPNEFVNVSGVLRAGCVRLSSGG